MKNVLILLSFIGLGLTLIPAIMVFKGRIDESTCKQLMALGTLLWFISAPYWMNKNKDDKSPQTKADL